MTTAQRKTMMSKYNYRYGGWPKDACNNCGHSCQPGFSLRCQVFMICVRRTGICDLHERKGKNVLMKKPLTSLACKRSTTYEAQTSNAVIAIYSPYFANKKGRL